MRKNLITVILVFVCSFSLIFVAGCAKKEVVKSEVELTQAQPSAEETAQQAQAKKEADLREQALKEQALKEKTLAEAAAFQDIHFSFDNYDLKPEARVLLGELADWLLEHGGFEVTIEGHCDSRGTAVYNLALGERRADVAKAYLVNLGVANTQITTISYGEELPADPRNCEEAWIKNRRDHFIVFPNKQ
ncbi:MAG: OmpA family protein [Deltaproteobacteria bacterium]|nr:OmpA family protein [Deltaproteobacteria bacterium]